MLYGGISTYIVFHSEISEMSAYIMLPCKNHCFHVACMYYGARSGALRAPELAEQSGLALGSICKALGNSWSALGTLRDGSQIAPEWSPSGSKIAPNSILEPLRELLELSWQPGGLLEASWEPLGALLEASGTEKKISRAAPGRSKRNSKRGFSYLKVQKAPETEPGSVRNRVQEATRAENAISSKTIVFSIKINEF